MKAYKTLMKGCNVELFEPFHKVAAHKKTLHKVDYDVGLIELNKHKKEDKELAGVAPTEKVEVPYLCMKNLPESVLKILIQCDRDGTYYRHDFQPFDSWDILWAGDMGAKSTKFGFFNTCQHKF